MRTSAIVVGALCGIGFLLGGALGEATYREVSHPEALCATCHHAAGPSSRGTPPHSTNYAASCHICHVIPLEEYVETTAGLVGVEVDWPFEDPVIDDQSCMECHLARGRGDILCEGCHRDGSREVDTTLQCTSCHVGHEALPPHGDVECRHCHPDATWRKSSKTEASQ